MNKRLLLFGIVAALTTGWALHGVLANESAPSSQSIEQAIALSLPYLYTDGDRWMEGKVSIQDGSRCVSCHHVGYALWSHREAELAGVTVLSTKKIDDLSRRASEFLAQPDKPRVVSATQMLMAKAHGEHDLKVLQESVEKAGNWRARGQFPSQIRGEEEGDHVASLWALAALASLDEMDNGMKKRYDRALIWLAESERGISSEWVLASLIVAHQQQEPTRALLDQTLASQHSDGGWGWLPKHQSNAFSTGQAVYALATIDDPRAEDALQRGIRYLLNRQEADGSWETLSRLTSTEPTEAKDYIYRYWGTAWASMGLSRSLARR